MKYAKMLGLLAVAAAAFMALVGTASATTLTSPTGTTFTGSIHAVSENGHVKLHSPLSTIECNSTVQGEVKTHGSGVTASGPITSLLFTECTNENTVTVKKAGTLEVHWTSGYNGTLTSSGAEIEVYSHSFGGSCIYTTNATDIGTITGGTEATLDIDSAAIPRTGGSLGFFCGSSGEWTGNYKVTTPHTLYVDK
jgi:hypothetical protein